MTIRRPLRNSMILAGQVALLAMLSNPAFAIWADRTAATDRQENTTLNLVRVQGVLSCDMGSQNTGEGCTLKIKDNRSGRMFKLVEDGAQAMRLFDSGTRNVTIEGETIESDSIRINKIQNSRVN